MSIFQGKRTGALTELLRDIGPDDTSIPVHSSDAHRDYGRIRIAGENIDYTSKSTGWFLGCTRGVTDEYGTGTAPQSHPGGSLVWQDALDEVIAKHDTLLIASRPIMQFIEGDGVDIAVQDNPAENSTDVVVGLTPVVPIPRIFTFIPMTLSATLAMGARFGAITFGTAMATLRVHVWVDDAANGVWGSYKTYLINVGYNTPQYNNWFTVIPERDSGPQAGNDFELQIFHDAFRSIYFKAVRTKGTTATVINCIVEYIGPSREVASINNETLQEASSIGGGGIWNDKSLGSDVLLKSVDVAGLTEVIWDDLFSPEFASYRIEFFFHGQSTNNASVNIRGRVSGVDYATANMPQEGWWNTYTNGFNGWAASAASFHQFSFGGGNPSNYISGYCEIIHPQFVSWTPLITQFTQLRNGVDWITGYYGGHFGGSQALTGIHIYNSSGTWVSPAWIRAYGKKK